MARLTRTAVAKASELSVRRLSLIERGLARPTPEEAGRLTSALTVLAEVRGLIERHGIDGLRVLLNATTRSLQRLLDAHPELQILDAYPNNAPRDVELLTRYGKLKARKLLYERAYSAAEKRPRP